MKRSATFLAAGCLITAALSLCPFAQAAGGSSGANSMQGSMAGKGATPAALSPGTNASLTPELIPPTGFVLEGVLGGDTSLSGSYSTTGGQTVPYDFGSAPLWGIRAGKMLFPKVMAYLTLQQSYFSRNTHTLIGLGGNAYLPRISKTDLLPYLNATFGASYNTYTGVNAQAGYSWMLGAGLLYPLSTVLGVFVEADILYETAPTGITTSLGSPPGNVSQVSDTWSVPVMMGIRYAF